MLIINQESVGERLKKLDAQNRKLRFAHLLNFVLLIAWIAVSGFQYFGLDFTQGKIVSAEKFVLKDGQGRIRAELKSDAYTTYFALFDANGVQRSSMAVADGDPGFHLYDEYGFRQAVMGISPEGPRLVFMKQWGLQHAGISLLSDGHLGFYSGRGNDSNRPIPLYSSCSNTIDFRENLF